MQQGTAHGFQRAVCTGHESVSETKTRAHRKPCRAPALAPAAAWTVSAALPSKEGPEAQGQPCTPWPGSASLLHPVQRAFLREANPTKGGSPRRGWAPDLEGSLHRPSPPEWRGPERVSGGAGDTKRPEASLISPLRVALTSPCLFCGPGPAGPHGLWTAGSHSQSGGNSSSPLVLSLLPSLLFLHTGFVQSTASSLPPRRLTAGTLRVTRTLWLVCKPHGGVLHLMGQKVLPDSPGLQA